MNQDLEFLQRLKESEFTQIILIPLLEAMGFIDIRYTHGILERGKDVVFFEDHPLHGRNCLAAVVKREALDGSVSGARSIREVYYQIQQCISEPFVDPTTGETVRVHAIFVVTPSVISQTTIGSVAAELRRESGAVTFIDGAKLISHLTRYLPDLLPSLPNQETRYLHSLLRRFTDQSGVGRLGSAGTRTLLDIYTGGDLSLTSPVAAKMISFAAQPPVDDRIPIGSVLVKHKFCVVIADVGAGKTSLLQRIIIQAASYEPEKVSEKLLPLFIPLAGLSDECLATTDAFLVGIERYLQVTEGFSDFTWTDAQGYALLLDGFDELPFGHEVVTKSFGRLQGICGSLIITSRSSRIPLVDDSFSYLRLNPFSNDNVLEFLGKWFSENPQKVGELWMRIRTNSALMQFCRSPLMLTLYAILATGHKGIDSLPVRRTEIYSKISEMLLGEWDGKRRVRNNFSVHEKVNILEHLAYTTHSSKRRTFTFSAIQSACQQAGVKEKEVTLIIEEIIYRGSLIRQAVSGGFEFVHLSFQEFFSASRMSRLGTVKGFQELLLDDWWKASLVFYFGLKRTFESSLLTRRFARLRGAGLRLTEYLSEADFTDQPTKDRIAEILAGEILIGRDLTEEEVVVCAKVGDKVVSSLCEGVNFDEVPPSEQNPGNLMRVLACVGSEFSIKQLVQRKEIIDELSEKHLFGVLILAIPHLTNIQGAVFLQEAIKHLDEKLLEAPQRSFQDVDELSQANAMLRATSLVLDVKFKGGKNSSKASTLSDKTLKWEVLLRKRKMAALCRLSDRPLLIHFKGIFEATDIDGKKEVVEAVAKEIARRIDELKDAPPISKARFLTSLDKVRMLDKADEEAITVIENAIAFIGINSRVNRKF
jgi:NACHT domain